MANNCAFEINIKAQTTEDADRAVRIIRFEDPEYCILRGWPDYMHVTDGEDSPERTIEGLCPWTADYMWDPANTLYGHGMVPGETRLSDGRILASIPWMCRTWNMEAWGWEEEPGCGVDGEFLCRLDGVLHYTDLSGEDEDEEEDEEEEGEE